MVWYENGLRNGHGHAADGCNWRRSRGNLRHPNGWKIMLHNRRSCTVWHFSGGFSPGHFSGCVQIPPSVKNNNRVHFTCAAAATHSLVPLVWGQHPDYINPSGLLQAEIIQLPSTLCGSVFLWFAVVLVGQTCYFTNLSFFPLRLCIFKKKKSFRA